MHPSPNSSLPPFRHGEQHEPVDQRVLDQLAPISEKRVGGMSAPHSGAHWAQGHVLVRTCNIQPHKTLHDWAHSEQTQQHVGKLQSGCKLAKQPEQPLSLLEVYPPNAGVVNRPAGTHQRLEEGWPGNGTHPACKNVFLLHLLFFAVCVHKIHLFSDATYASSCTHIHTHKHIHTLSR